MIGLIGGVFIWMLLVMTPTVHASITDCVVRGMVYGSDDMAEVDAQLAAPDFCQLRIMRYERHLTILSRTWRVELVIPPDLRGWTRFYYLWGYGVAYLGTTAIAVEYGPAEQG